LSAVTTDMGTNSAIFGRKYMLSCLVGARLIYRLSVEIRQLLIILTNTSCTG
jgi:hypothetical protein